MFKKILFCKTYFRFKKAFTKLERKCFNTFLFSENNGQLDLHKARIYFKALNKVDKLYRKFLNI